MAPFLKLFDFEKNAEIVRSVAKGGLELERNVGQRVKEVPLAKRGGSKRIFTV